MHKNRLKCAECGARNSKVGISKKTGNAVAVCLECKANIALYIGEDERYHPMQIPAENRKPDTQRRY